MFGCSSEFTSTTTEEVPTPEFVRTCLISAKTHIVADKDIVSSIGGGTLENGDILCSIETTALIDHTGYLTKDIVSFYYVLDPLGRFPHTLTDIEYEAHYKYL
jgi:hypothetical protein